MAQELVSMHSISAATVSVPNPTWEFQQLPPKMKADDKVAVYPTMFEQTAQYNVGSQNGARS